MGLSVSKLVSVWSEILKHKFFSKAMEVVVQRSMSFKNWDSKEVKTNTFEDDGQSLDSTSSKNRVGRGGGGAIQITTPTISLPEPAMFFCSELDAAAIKLQKVYKSYRTRRNLADCAVVIEELWWKTLDSVSLFNIEKPETAASRWARGRTRAAKVGKGLSKDEKARKLALQHWLEAIDPRHRYGHNLHFYYDVWSDSKSSQPFFYWLDVGDGKEVNVDKCPRIDVQRQCIRYLGSKEREAYEVIVENGKLVYRQNGMLVDTIEGSKTIFVLSTSRCLYVGNKKKGEFQHSSFLSGAATTAAGRLVARDGVLEAIWPYSGHYLPTEDNFKEFISFLEDQKLDISNVKRCAIDEDKNISESKTASVCSEEVNDADARIAKDDDEEDSVGRKQPSKGLSCKWTSGVGPRIGCVRDYPSDLQWKALEQVKLSPKLNGTVSSSSRAPIPSPRPSPKVRLSPRLAYMGLPSPRVHACS